MITIRVRLCPLYSHCLPFGDTEKSIWLNACNLTRIYADGEIGTDIRSDPYMVFIYYIYWLIVGTATRASNNHISRSWEEGSK